MSGAATRIARLETAREGMHIRRFEAEANAAGWPVRDQASDLTTAELEGRIALGYGLAVEELRALIAEDAAAFRAGARYADLRLARLVPRPVTDRGEGPR